MQIASESVQASPPSLNLHAEAFPSNSPPTVEFKVIRRNGAVVGFEPAKISIALTKAFLAVTGGQGAVSARVREVVAQLTQGVVDALTRRQPHGGTFHIEDIQDQVELALMRSGEHDVARAYVLYREKRTQERALKRQSVSAAEPDLHVVENGVRMPLDRAALLSLIEDACAGLGDEVGPEGIFEATLKNIYDGVPSEEVRKSAILSARTLIEKDPAYSYVTARLLLHTIGVKCWARRSDRRPWHPAMSRISRSSSAWASRPSCSIRALPSTTWPGSAAIDAERDLKFGYLGLQTLYDRYFLHIDERRIELPQAFFMRVAMGLALNEIDREARAIEFYEVLSKLRFHEFDADAVQQPARCHPQLSSCYLTTVATIWTASTRPSRKTPCCRSTPAAWATTGRRCVRWARASRAPTARARV
jgi:ribonucleoside-diphosphate reductase alpha chain